MSVQRRISLNFPETIVATCLTLSFESLVRVESNAMFDDRVKLGMAAPSTQSCALVGQLGSHAFSVESPIGANFT